MKDGARNTEAPGRQGAGYREVGCGTLSFYDAEGERLSTVTDEALGDALAAGRRPGHPAAPDQSPPPLPRATGPPLFRWAA